MKKLMLAIALVSFTAFSFAATPTTTPAAKPQTTQSTPATKKAPKKAVKKAVKKADASTAKTASDKK